MLKFFRGRKRAKLARRPFPPEWEAIVSSRLTWHAQLPREDLERWRTHLKVFAWEKHFVGARELEMTDEIRVVISGQAARLSRNLPLDAYDRLSEVVVYPSHYMHPERDAIIYGEANAWGTVVLSWDAVRHGLCDPRDGRDTSLHEFAHALDIEDGVFDGTPPLRCRTHYRSWSRVLGKQYAELLADPTRGVVREYGAINAAEFFAVATEAFFERPKHLRRRAPDLYAELQRYYHVDPARS